MRRYVEILENIEGRIQRYYYKREPKQLIPLLVPDSSLNCVVRSEDRSDSTQKRCYEGLQTITVVSQLPQSGGSYFILAAGGEPVSFASPRRLEDIYRNFTCSRT